MEGILSINHWKDINYRQRVTRKQWKEILLSETDAIIFKGNLYKLKAKYIAAGVYEIYKEVKP